MPASPAIRWTQAALLATSLVLGACGGGGGGASIAVNNPPTAHAGADQTVLLSSAVTLNGSGTDADGSIASYSWTQTSGTGVTLTGANAATATFTAPATAGSLTFSLTVTDNRGATSAADSITITVQVTATVSGQITFDFVPFRALPGGFGLDYANIVIRPARGVVVEAIDAASGTLVLATTSTDATGNYSLTLAPGLNIFIRAKAEMRKVASAGSPSSWDFQLRDNTSGNALYAISGAAFSTSAAGTHNLRAPLAFNGATYTDRRAAPFAVLDTVYQAFNMVLAASPSLVFPELSLYWSTQNRADTSCTVELGCIGVTHYETGPQEGIYIQGTENDDTDEYDTHVIAHEWGHYFQDKFSRDDSVGGSHSLGNRLDARVAFSEGWGNALSGMALTDPVYRDSSGPQQAAEFNFSVESETTPAPGWFSETSVQDVIYDIFDAQADAGDTVNLGFAPIFAVMTGDVRTSDAMTGIYPFIRGLKQRQPASAAAIETLLAQHQIIGVHPGALSADFGSAESNFGDDARNLPIYAPITVGATVTVTSRAANSTDAGTRYNKLGNRRFLVFTLAATHATTISVSAPGCSAATPTTDPDVLLFHAGGDPVAVAETFGCDTLIPVDPLLPGTYVIETYEFSNIDLVDGQPAGDTDIAVTLN